MKSFLKGAIATAFCFGLFTGAAKAHVVEIAWQQVTGGGTVFYAGDYHSDDTSQTYGGIVVNNITYNFVHRITTAQAETIIDRNGPQVDHIPEYNCPNCVRHFQISPVIYGLWDTLVTVTTTNTTVVEHPWPGAFPRVYFIESGDPGPGPTAMPAPGGLAALGLGLIGLTWMRRKRK